MKPTANIVLAQLNLTVGDIKNNLQKHINAANEARDKYGADIILFPEMGISSYPAEDLLLRDNFVADCEAAIVEFAKNTQGIYCIIGHPIKQGKRLYNACSIIYNGQVLSTYAKQRLPNYGVFDETRYFTTGKKTCVLPINGINYGIIICEDIWEDEPIANAVKQGAEAILVLNASPFEIDKFEKRSTLLARHAQKNHVPIFYTNYVGGQDELIFDGGSMVVNAQGEVVEFAGFFDEKIFPVTLNLSTMPPKSFSLPATHQLIYDSLVFALKEYVEKNNFPGVVLGLSGGIDSALTLAIAVDALGKDKVHVVTMPSRYTSEISNTDAVALAKNFGVDIRDIAIEAPFSSFMQMLAPSFENTKADVTEENLQARCRAVLLMALSNKFSWLVLTTGNRSESAVGYCTLYGDMAGGYALLKDISKTLVYELSNYRNSVSAMIPQRIIDRPPSAELAPDQKDEDSLPPYSVLDKILDLYISDGLGCQEIIAQGYEKDVVSKVIKLIHRSEYKRSQAAIGPRMNPKSFGKDWRYPITNKYNK